jgi:hypothetical protein
MSNNIFLEKDFNKIIVANIFSSLIESEKWDMLLEMFKSNILEINSKDIIGDKLKRYKWKKCFILGNK